MSLPSQRFQAVVEPHYGAFAAVVDEMHFPHCAVRLVAEVVISLRCVEMGKIGVQRSYVMIDAHLVVVEDYEEVVGGVCGIIQPFECEAAANGGVADDSHYIAPRVFAFELACHCHAECGGYAVGCMPGAECVVIAFRRVGKPAYASELAVAFRKCFAASGKQFVGICLMAYVPYDAVVRSVEHVVQCHSKLHCPHAGSEMSRICAQRIYEEFTDVGAQSRQLPGCKTS